ERLALFHLLGNALDQERIIFFAVVEQLGGGGRAVARNHVLRVQRLHHLSGGQDVGDIDEGTEDVDLVGHECGGRKQHTLLRQSDGGVGFAVNTFQVPQLEGPFADI